MIDLKGRSEQYTFFQMSIKQRSQNLIKTMESRVLVLDGAMGTALQNYQLTPDDFGGELYEGCNENLNLTRPDIVQNILEDYLAAGADIIESNSFGGVPFVLDEFSLGAKAFEINKTAAEIARRAADKFSTPDRPRFVAGSIGPTTKAITVTGGISFEDLIKNFKIQVQALYDGGVDYFLIETAQDTRNIKAALIAIDEAMSQVSEKIPVAVSGTIEPMGTMLAGQTVESLATSLEHVELLYIGLNCATGPEFMTDHIRTLAQQSGRRIACVPNAGLPDEYGNYLETPDMMAKVLNNFGEQGWLNVIGGCCGTHRGHIAAFAELAKKLKPRKPTPRTGSYLSGIDNLEVTDDQRPLIVGERTNSIGSRKFKRLIAEGKFDEASEIAKAQVKSGAHIIDVCLANPDRNELEDMRTFLEEVIKKVKAPLMIDSTDAKVIEMSLTYSQGKAIINSINLEDGEERFEHIIPMGKKFGAAYVVGTIDDDPEQGMGVTRARKLEIAKRSYKLLTEKYGVQPSDIYWDPLVFPCATGDAQYVGSAVETIEGIRLLKKEFPQTKSVLGISNVSFGLPEAGREVLNSVFLYHCTQAGLDLAIVNSEKLIRYPSIPEEEKRLSEDLLFNRGTDPVAAFAAHFREKKTSNVSKTKDLPIDQRLAQYIIEGTKDGLVDDLKEYLKSHKPLEIINGPLMKGMDEVGRLFNANELIVAEVLQSAESMKAAVGYLESFMDKTEEATRGKMVLATVKGDVHDIGKNLVEIIFSNNGFKIINLGIKVPPEVLIKAIREHKPELIGLSGLLVKSAQQMVITAKDLTTAGIKVPMLVGGAALSRNFVDKQIAPEYADGFVDYANDAMHGLDLAKKIVSSDDYESHKLTVLERRKKLESSTAKKDELLPETETRSSNIDLYEPSPAPDFDRHIFKQMPIETIWNFINPLMLYTRHLGLKGSDVRKWTDGDIKSLKDSDQGLRALEVFEITEQLKQEYKSLLKPRAVYKFFEAKSSGNELTLFDAGQIAAKFKFPRQRKEDGLCLADYVLPMTHNKTDNICLFVVTCGEGIRATAEELKNAGKYLKSHALQALAIESAEAYAELMHSQVRKMWGFPDPVDLTMSERFQAKYHGKRYSFGYPACPDLSDQKTLFSLLKPEEIGVNLTEEFMMDPEASVSAIVFQHPQAIYFAAGSPT